MAVTMQPSFLFCNASIYVRKPFVNLNILAIRIILEISQEN